MDLRLAIYMNQNPQEIADYLKTLPMFYILPTDQPGVLALSLSEKTNIPISRKALLERLDANQAITTLRVYEKRPFHIDLSADLLRSMEKPEPIIAPASEPTPAPAAAPVISNTTEPVQGKLDDRTQKAVNALKKMLDCQDRSKISTLPTYSYFEKFPELMSKLFTISGLDRDAVGKELGLAEGVVTSIISDPKTDITKDVLRKFLTYFGLEQYIYRYRGNCQELWHELAASPNIREVAPAGSKTAERFRLLELRKGLDHAENAWLYQIRLKSDQREFVCNVVSPLGLMEGKEYEIKGLEPQGQTGSDIAGPPSDDEAAAAIAKAKEKAEKEARAYLDTRKDYIIRYFKLQNPEGKALEAREAEKYYRIMSKSEDLMDEFFWKHCMTDKVKMQLEQDPEYLRRRENQPKDLRVRDYTAEKLQREFRLKAWEAYFFMADLRKTPQKTMERLKYRLTDPQYQNKKD